MRKDDLKDEFDHVVEEIKEGVGPGGAYEPTVANAKKNTKLLIAIAVVLAAVVIAVVRCHS